MSVPNADTDFLIFITFHRYVVGLVLAPERPHATVVTLEKSFPKADASELRYVDVLKRMAPRVINTMIGVSDNLVHSKEIQE